MRHWDFTSFKQGKCQPSPGNRVFTYTQTAHTIPLSLLCADADKTVRKQVFRSCKAIYMAIAQLFKKCNIRSVIKSFTSIDFEELNCDEMNSSTNVMTLDVGVHTTFRTLDLWFEAIPVRCPPTHYVMIDIPPRIGPTLTKSGRLRKIFFLKVSEANLFLLHRLTIPCSCRWC